MDPRNEPIPQRVLEYLRALHPEEDDFEIKEIYGDTRALLLELAIVLWDLAEAEESLVPPKRRFFDELRR